MAHLQRLACELARWEFRAELNATAARPYLQVTNPDVAGLSERVICLPVGDGRWGFWWGWRHPIGSVDEVTVAAQRIVTVLRSVEGNTR